MPFTSQINEICIVGRKRRLYAFAYADLQMCVIRGLMIIYIFKSILSITKLQLASDIKIFS